MQGIPRRPSGQAKCLSEPYGTRAICKNANVSDLGISYTQHLDWEELLVIMQRVCFVLQVQEGRLAEYEERHRNVWLDMQVALKEAGWTNYSLFLRSDGLLVGYLETDDFERARAEISKRKVNETWQREMAGFFVQTKSGTLPDRAIEPLQEIFHLS